MNTIYKHALVACICLPYSCMHSSLCHKCSYCCSARQPLCKGNSSYAGTCFYTNRELPLPNIFNTDKALRILVTLRALPPLRSLCCYRCCCCPYCPIRLSPFFTQDLRVTYGKFNLRLHYIMKLNGFVNNNTSRRITPLS